MFIEVLLIIAFIVQTNDLKDKIPPCPESPNCVNSVYTEDADHYLEPLKIDGDIDESWKNLKSILLNDRLVEIIQEEEYFIQSEFSIPVFRFIDDVVFYLDRKNELIHFRSASRVGYSDLGVNKNRIQKLRKKLEQLGLE